MQEILLFAAVLQLFVVAGLLSILLFWVRKRRLFGYITVISIGISLISSVLLGYLFYVGDISNVFYYAEWPLLGFSLSFLTDSLSIIMMIMVSGLSLIIAIYSMYYMEEEYGFERFFVFYIFFVASMMLVVSSNNLLLLFVGWEGTGLASYALISHWYKDEEEHMVGDGGRRLFGVPMFSFPSESGLKAILFTRIPDVLMLMGIFIVFYFTGTLDINELMENAGGFLNILYKKGVLSVVFLFLVLGPFAKSAQFPFHEWLVTAMTGPTPVSALIHAATMVKAGVYFMLRITPFFVIGSKELLLEVGGSALPVLSVVHYSYLFVAIIGALTAFALASMAIVAREAKLILAYSTASQLGYMFMGIGASAFSGEPGLLLSLVSAHLIAHAIFKAGLFLGTGILIHKGKSRYIDEWPMLSSGLKTTLLFMWILILSLAGLPPLIGFWTKDSLIEGIFSSGLLSMGIIGLFTVLITGFYSSRLLLFNNKYNRGKEMIKEPPSYVLGTYGILAIVSLLLGLAWPLVGKYYNNFLSPSFLSKIEAFQLVEDPQLVFISLILLLLGLGLSYAAYLKKVIDTEELCDKFSYITGFLYDRWYINVFYYKFTEKLVFPAANLLYNVVEKGLDRFYNDLLPSAADLLSIRLVRLHSGDLRKYIYLFFIGVVLLLLLLLLLFVYSKTGLG